MNIDFDAPILTFKNKLLRVLWKLSWLFLCQYTPRPMHAWRAFVLSIFGAKLAAQVHVYPRAKIWAPWNLTMGVSSCLADDVDCYNVGKISIGKYTTVSQYSYLCTASHNYNYSSMPLVTAPIIIGDNVWITADVFIAPGVEIGNGVVVTARSSVFTSIPQWTIARGNPATVIKSRSLQT